MFTFIHSFVRARVCVVNLKAAKLHVLEHPAQTDPSNDACILHRYHERNYKFVTLIDAERLSKHVGHHRLSLGRG